MIFYFIRGFIKIEKHSYALFESFKQLHGQIKKDKKTIELFKEKIAKLILEKKKLEEKQQSKGESDQFDKNI